MAIEHFFFLFEKKISKKRIISFFYLSDVEMNVFGMILNHLSRIMPSVPLFNNRNWVNSICFESVCIFVKRRNVVYYMSKYYKHMHLYYDQMSEK